MKPASNILRLNEVSVNFILFMIGVLLYTTIGISLKVPGYMDAEYYYLGGVNLASGNGFQEMILWNYLDSPSGLPHPSHTYWMPFPSILAGIGLFTFGRAGFFFAQIPFILLAALIAPLTFGISRKIYPHKSQALFAAMISLFPGFYVAYLTTTATITPYMILGGLFTWLVLTLQKEDPGARKHAMILILLGITAGFLHLTRSDGVLWLMGALLAAFAAVDGVLERRKDRRQPIIRFKPVILNVVLVLAGYIPVMGPWILRNFTHFDRPFAPGGFSTIWLSAYNQTFIYPGSQLSFSNWIEQGWGEIFFTRFSALLTNLLTFIAVEGQIILFPLILIGILKFRKKKAVQNVFLVWLMTYLLMSLIFPFAGMRGGFLHASAGFQPFFWAMIPMGYQMVIQWGVRRRNWVRRRSERVFQAGIIVILAMITAFAFYAKVVGPNPGKLLWQSSWLNYVEIENRIRQDFPDLSQVIVVNNPPGYYLASGGRSSIVIPDGDQETLFGVAEKYGAEIIAIDRNIVEGLRPFYLAPSSTSWLKYLYTVNETNIFRVQINHGNK